MVAPFRILVASSETRTGDTLAFFTVLGSSRSQMFLNKADCTCGSLRVLQEVTANSPVRYITTHTACEGTAIRHFQETTL